MKAYVSLRSKAGESFGILIDLYPPSFDATKMDYNP